MATPFLTALEYVSELAHAKLPATLHGRLERATAIVLHGGVFFDDAGLCQVRGADEQTWYTVNGHCPCGDLQAPDHLCKHRLARGLYLRAAEVLRQPGAAPGLEETPATPQAALPEAPASINVRVLVGGREVQWTLRDTDETRLAERLEALLARYPVETAASPASAAAATAQPTPDGWCVRHSVQMRLNQGKDGRTWYSHKTADGWCKGK